MTRRNNTEKTFTFFFLGGYKYTGVGSTVSEAFVNAGGGCVSDIDFLEDNEESAAKWTWDATAKNWVHNS